MKRSIIGLWVAAAILAGPALAGNPPAIEWERAFGPDTSCGPVRQTLDGGYILAGIVRVLDGNGYTTRKPYLERLDSLGSTHWRRVYDSLPYGGNGAYGVRQANDGGYVFDTYGGDSVLTVVVVKTDSQGGVQWSYLDEAESPYWLTGGTCTTADGGVAVAGFCISDSIFLLKLDSAGNRVWLRRFHDTRSRDWGIGTVPVAQTASGGYIVGSDRLLRTDSLGNQMWRVGFDLVYAIFDVAPTPDGGYVATGVGGNKRAWMNRNRYKLCLLKVNSQGALQWRKLFAFSDDGTQGISVDVTSDGGYFVCGEDGTGMAVRFNAQGVELWRKSELNGNCWASSGRQTVDGGYVIAVHDKLIKLAADGQ